MQVAKKYIAALYDYSNAETVEKRAAYKRHFMEWDEPGLLAHLFGAFPSATGHERKLLLEKLATYGADAAPCVPELLDLYHSGMAGRKGAKAILGCLRAIGEPIKEPLLLWLSDEVDVDLNDKLELAELFSAFPEGTLGEELWPLIEQHNTPDGVRLSLRLIAELGRHKATSVLPQLAALAERQLRREDMHDKHFEMYRHCMVALAEMGEAALPYLDGMLERFQIGGQFRGAVLYAMIVLGEEGQYDTAVRDALSESQFLTRQSFTMALSGIERSTSMRYFDLLVDLLNEDSLRHPRRPVYKAFVVCLSQRMEPTEFLAWVRQLLDRGPSPRLWFLLAALVNESAESERELLLPYLQEHLATWKLHECHMTLGYDEEVAAEDRELFWLEKRDRLVLQPAWSLLRSFSFDGYHSPHKQAYIMKMLASPDAQGLEQLTLKQCRLDRGGKWQHLVEAPLPSLKRLHVASCSLPLDTFELLLEAPWISRLEELSIVHQALEPERLAWEPLREVMAPGVIFTIDSNRGRFEPFSQTQGDVDGIVG